MCRAIESLYISGIDSSVVNAWKMSHFQKKTRQRQHESSGSPALLVSSLQEGARFANLALQIGNFPFGKRKRDDEADKTSSTGIVSYSLPDGREHMIRHKDGEKFRERCVLCKNNSIHYCWKCEQHMHPECPFAQHRRIGFIPGNAELNRFFEKKNCSILFLIFIIKNK